MACLSAVDASFLRVETPTAHMHVGWLALVDLPAGSSHLNSDVPIERIEARLHLAPRFRQRGVKVPLSVAEPVWRDCPDLDIRRHVSMLPGRGELKGDGLHAAADEFFSRPLDRERPLWELLVVPRLRRRRAALLGKVHHAMVDGIAAVEPLARAPGDLAIAGRYAAQPEERDHQRHADDPESQKAEDEGP